MCEKTRLIPYIYINNIAIEGNVRVLLALLRKIGGEDILSKDGKCEN